MPAKIAVAAAQFEAHASEAAALLKVLANEHRLGVLCQLVAGELSVGELNTRIALSQSALSQHLAVLRAEALVTTRREAQVIYYRLADGPVHEIIETLHRIYCAPPARGGTRNKRPSAAKVRAAAGGRGTAKHAPKTRGTAQPRPRRNAGVPVRGAGRGTPNRTA